MDTSLLLGRTVAAVWLFRSEGVHPAWVDELTLPIAAFAAFLQFDDGDLVRISPCEVDLGADHYPALGLAVQRCTSEALRFVLPGDYCLEAVALAEAAPLLPFSIVAIEPTDPLGEGTASQYALLTSNGRQLTFRHMLPPMTLGMQLGLVGGSSGGSSKPKPPCGPP